MEHEELLRKKYSTNVGSDRRKCHTYHKFLIYGKSHVLSQHLPVLYSDILTLDCVSGAFSNNVLVLGLTRATLDPNSELNCSPITISLSYMGIIHVDLYQIIVLHISLLNDALCCRSNSISNVFLCCLASEECLASITCI